jgi:hypothetical protein
MEPHYDALKFKELIIYIARAEEGDPSFGATKLNKILFFSDFLAYGRLGAAITGAEYQRLQFGPAPRQLPPVQKALEKEKAAVLQERWQYTQAQKRLVALRPPDLTRFSAPEIKLVDEVIEVMRQFNAIEVSALSHLERGWQIAKEGQTIPYGWVFLSSDPLTEDDIAWGQKVAADHGWLNKSA